MTFVNGQVHKQTADRLRESLNAQHPPSNPLLHDHFTNLGVISHMITDPSNGAPPPSADELRKLHRVELSSAPNPMTIYSRLKISGALKSESCMALLSNPNLNSPDDIELIATENQISPSYVVAKLMKLTIRPSPDILSKWMKRVPSVTSIYRECVKIASQPKPKRNLEATDPRLSLKQCRMDLAAHMSYLLETKDWETAFRRWVSWTRKGTPNELPLEMKKSVLKIPSLQLLQMALRFKDPNDDVVTHVGMLLDWDESIVNIPTQNEFCEQVVSFLLDSLPADKSAPLAAERLLRILDIVRGSLSPERYLYAMDVAVQTWMENAEDDDLEWVQSFVARTKEDLYPSVDLSQRGHLDRLTESLNNVGLQEDREQKQSTGLKDVVLASLGLNLTTERVEGGGTV